MGEVVFTAKFEGDIADQHKVPAYNAIQALYGLSRGIIIPSHYLLEGRVRHRNIESPKYELYLTPPREGSFEAIMQLVFVAGAAVANHPIGAAVTADLITNTVMATIKRAVGVGLSQAEKEIEEEQIARGGDLAAMAAAVEPALRQSHHIINNGVMNINFISSSGGNVELDQSTKNYINTIHREGQIRIGLLSVGSYNANSRSGGAFDPQAGRIIPFTVNNQIDRESIATILKSQQDYALGMFDPDEDGSYVAFQFERILDLDGTVKRIEVHRVRPNIDDF